ncbi:MAG: DNA-3-methyladenine glycosylase I [Candidatus Komeilibacteria bacterium]
MNKIRCGWVSVNPLMIKYHDTEWGVPLHNDRKLFEFFILDAFQAGLSWNTIINKRKNLEKAFANFDPKKVTKFGAADRRRLLADAVIIRNRLKIEGSIKNARAFLQIQQEFGSFDKYIWQFTKHRTIKNRWQNLKELPAKTKEAEAMSKDIKRRGFTFCGPTICYAFMQAAGMVNDHLVNCWRYRLVR